MITIFRTIRLWQLRTKWKLAFWQFIDKQMMELIKDPEKINEMVMNYLTELIHNSAENQNN